MLKDVEIQKGEPLFRRFTAFTEFCTKENGWLSQLLAGDLVGFRMMLGLLLTKWPEGTVPINSQVQSPTASDISHKILSMLQG